LRGWARTWLWVAAGLGNRAALLDPFLSCRCCEWLVRDRDLRERPVRSAGRVPSSPAGIDILVRSLAGDDQVALEATGNALQIARLLEPHVARVVVAPTKELSAITTAKVKTDRLDARKLARLLAAGLLTGCWLPDEATRSLRRWLSRRAQLVRQRTRSKNEIHAVLMRNLKGRPPMSDAFGKGGRKWLAGLKLPLDERQTVDGCLRQIDFLGGEIAILEREIAQRAIDSRLPASGHRLAAREPRKERSRDLTFIRAQAAQPLDRQTGLTRRSTRPVTRD
jgi:transposase